MNTQQQTNEQVSIPQFNPGSFDLTAYQKVRENNSWQRVEQPWKSSYNHACANSELGEMLNAVTKPVALVNGIKQYATLFVYQYGAVLWDEQKQWKDIDQQQEDLLFWKKVREFNHANS